MTIGELHSLFYSWVLVPLKEVNTDNGERIYFEYIDGIRLKLVYQNRPNEFAHNYERNKFLHNRDKYVYASSEGIHLITETSKKHITIYEKNMRVIFGADTDKAIKVLSKMLRKVYDSVRIQERSNIRYFDSMPSGRYQERGEFNEV